MESSIAGMLILGVLIVAVVLMSRAYVVSNTLLGTAMIESINMADERSRTELTIKSWELTLTPSPELTIEVENTGSVPIADYHKMDVFVGSERLDYAAGQWSVNGGSIWKPGETRQITVPGHGDVGDATPVVVSSPGGVPALSALSTPTPKEFILPCNEIMISTTTTSTVVACTEETQ